MKARPRSVENRAAEELNRRFAAAGFSPVERIPVLGRAGPDLTTNELRLVVDVKSRLEVPETIFFPLLVPFHFDQLLGVRLACLDRLWEEAVTPAPLDFSSKVIRSYWDHMEEWTREHCPDGISCLVLHRPQMPIGASVAVIHSKDRRRLTEYAAKHRSTNPRE